MLVEGKINKLAILINLYIFHEMFIKKQKNFV